MTHENRPRRSKKKARAISRDYTQLVERIMTEFIEAKERLTNAPIAAIHIDDDGRRLPGIYRVAEWCADIEIAVRHVLRYKPLLQHAFDTLEKEFAGIAIPEDEQLSLGLRTELIQTIGPILLERGLQPGRYFTKPKR